MDITKRADFIEIELSDEERTTLNRGDLSVLLNYNDSTWKRGDLIGVDGFYRYRNEGVYIWTGTKVVQLDHSQDYGGIPSSFLVGKEFHGQYWEGVINYNYTVYADFTEGQEINRDKEFRFSNVIFTLKGNKWAILSSKNAEIPEKIELFIFPNTEIHLYLEKPTKEFSKKHDIPVERILWTIEEY